LPRNRQPGTDEPDLIDEGNRGGVLRVPDADPLIRRDSDSRGVTPRAQVLVAATIDADTVADRHLGQTRLDVDPLGEVQGAVRLEGDRGNRAVVDRREPAPRPRVQDRSLSVVVPLAARSNARLIE